jgi:hypothetical protein
VDRRTASSLEIFVALRRFGDEAYPRGAAGGVIARREPWRGWGVARRCGH